MIELPVGGVAGDGRSPEPSSSWICTSAAAISVAIFIGDRSGDGTLPWTFEVTMTGLRRSSLNATSCGTHGPRGDRRPSTSTSLTTAS